MKKHRTINGVQRDQYAKMVYGFLRELYTELRRTENLYGQVYPMIKQHGMPSNIFSRLKGMGILKSKTHGRYQWVGQPPSMDMADAIISYYSASHKPKRPVTTSTLYQSDNGKKTTRYMVHIGSWSFMIPKIYVQKIKV